MILKVFPLKQYIGHVIDFYSVVVLVGLDSRTPVVAADSPPEKEPDPKRPRIDNDNKPKIPVMAKGFVSLSVSKNHKQLTLRIAPSQPRTIPYLPGEEVSMDVSVLGPNGKPVGGAEVSSSMKSNCKFNNANVGRYGGG